MTTCLGSQILWDADSAKLFRDRCRRTSRLGEEGQPCALASGKGRILLVSSRRPLTPQRTALAAEASAEARAVSGPSRSSEAEP
jgi:hypothetical protein